jgi:hypothetical protein
MLNAIARRLLTATLLLPPCVLGAPRAAHADDVRVETKEPGLEVWDRTSEVVVVPVRLGRYGKGVARSFVYKPLCTAASCTAQLAPGTHVLGLSRAGEPNVEAESEVNIGGPATVAVTYVDRSALRAAGIVTVVAGAAGGAALLVAAQEVATPSSSTFKPALAGLGLGVAGGGLIAGLIMMMQGDSATFTVTPMIGLPVGAKREGDMAVNGIAMIARF